MPTDDRGFGEPGEREGIAGLDDFNARSLQMRTGRMSSPDPLLGNALVNPQRWNAYSYVTNSPLVFVDPSGMDLVAMPVFKMTIVGYPREPFLVSQLGVGGFLWGMGGDLPAPGAGAPPAPEDPGGGGGQQGPIPSRPTPGQRPSEPTPCGPAFPPALIGPVREPGPPQVYIVKATEEGLIGGTTATGHVITTESLFVALPDRSALRSKVTLTFGSVSLTVPVLDVGPWNTTDPYWLTGGRPQAETGVDLFGRRTNAAGIDLSTAVFRKLGLRDNACVGWSFTR